MNEKNKNEFLDKMLEENEKYNVKMWGTLLFYKKNILKAATSTGIVIGGLLGPGIIGASGALSNQYCYIGITKDSINFVLINSFKLNIIENMLKINFNDIVKMKMKKSIIPGRYIVNIKTDNEQLKISLMNNAIGTDIKNQKESVKYIYELLNKKDLY